MNTKEDEAARESVRGRRFSEGMAREQEMEETAEYAAAKQWELSEREREIVRNLGCGRKDEEN